MRFNYLIIMSSIVFAIVAVSKSFKEFDEIKIFVKHLPMHLYHISCIAYGFYFVSNAIMLKYHPMEKKYKNLTEMNILMKIIAEESKNPIVIFDQMLPIYGNPRFKEEF